MVYATQKNCKFGVDPTVLATLPQNYKYFGGKMMIKHEIQRDLVFRQTHENEHSCAKWFHMAGI